MLPCSDSICYKLLPVSHLAKRVGKVKFVQNITLQMKLRQEQIESWDDKKVIILWLIQWLLNCTAQRRQKCNCSSKGNNTKGVWGCVLV